MATTHPADLQSAALTPHRIDVVIKVRTLLAHLLEIGRPAPPAELASRCKELQLSPKLVEFICSVPGSPIRLTEDRLVTYALESCRGFLGLRICCGSILRRLGSEGIGGLRLGIDCDVERKKREGGDLSGVKFMSAKRRARLIYCEDDETGSKALFPTRGSGSAVKEVSSLPAVYRRRSPRNHGGGSAGPLCSGSSGKLINKSETARVDSDVGFSGHLPTIVLHFKDSVTMASADTMNCAVLEPGIAETSHIVPLALTDDKMTGNEACAASIHGATILRSFFAADKIEIGDPQLGILDSSYAVMSFPHEVYKIPPCASGSQVVPLEVGETQIKTAQPVQKGPKTTSVFSSTTKESSQIFSMLRKGSKIDNARFSFEEAQKGKKREIQDIQQAADDHGFSKARRLFCDKTKSSHKSKLPSEQQNLLTPSRESLSKNANILKKTSNVPHRVEERKQADPLMDQTKKNANQKTHLEQKTYPSFESFDVEEEEGSGGYGTVFKARRKSDNEIFAIKCPHPNAPRHHIYNELSMLQRFGGKNFIIRLEDSFKYKDSRCFVLEHVVHDRPEVLKKEIDVSQLRWYAYCMFEALANLHKHGIVHRDIKPGNFLFSREVNIGYLIDFNLAMDLHQKSRHLKRPKMNSDATATQTPVSSVAHIPNKIRKFVSVKNKDAVAKAMERGSIADSKNLKAAACHTKTSTSFCKGKQILNNSQAALDDSGVTSLKDMTSSKTRTLDSMRQPIPSYNGRKEILKLAKEAMQVPKHKTLNVKAMKSKRILAPPEKKDRKPVFLSPMPLQSSGVAVLSAAPLGHKGDDKKRKEGPCAGTKGYRAPEVLFRSEHQGPKIDVWSAGVTLTYLLIGKTPFYGDINENIKGIAMLRGSEDLWEVAKLHNQESAFPQELLDVKFLPSIKLREWCQRNSKRPSAFINEAPDVLYDFLDKCLTVNPRLRISAEDALQHEFLNPCRDMLLQQAVISSPTI